jgi:uncharacterized protein (DUF2252 family)
VAIAKTGAAKKARVKPREITHATLEERRARGKAARKQVPLNSHGDWVPAPDRADAVALLQAQDADRERDLIPIRHGRMMVSPFTFYRGAAKIMAADLAATPTAGLDVQLCGDAHLSNFGAFASPERLLLFDVNDFDETLPGPFEYDVKRLAASFTICARNNAFGKTEAREATLEATRSYHQAMTHFAGIGVLDIWYARMDSDDLLANIRTSGLAKKKAANRAMTTAAKSLEKARTRDSLQAVSKLCEVVDGQYRIISQPPLIVPLRDLAGIYGIAAGEVEEFIHGMLRAYRESLPDDRRELLERFEFVDAARKVVGVGSVGTRCFIALLRGRDENDPLVLQIKEATASVLEDVLAASRYANHGERVVRGQRMMQASSDIFLGWTVGLAADRHYYWRQLHDMKGSLDVESTLPAGLLMYARLCGWTLARAHARSGDPVAIAAYLGNSDQFDTSITGFAERYADQNERDYHTFTDAISAGRIEARPGL